MKSRFFGLLCMLCHTLIYGQAAKPIKDPRHIISFNPVHLISGSFVGVGFNYERIVNDYLGLKLPLMVGINNQYVNLGIEAKLYPTTNKGPVKYAVAPTLMVGLGNNEYEELMWTQGGYVRYTVREPASHIGFIMNNSVNILVNKQFHIGLNGGIGLNYYDEAAVDGNRNTNMSFLAQLYVGMGYCF